MDLLDRLNEQIEQQTRNGRDNLYLKVEDLKQLGIKVEDEKEDRCYVRLACVRSAMQKFKFKQSMRVDTVNKTQEHKYNSHQFTDIIK